SLSHSWASILLRIFHLAPATSAIYTLSLHDALPIYQMRQHFGIGCRLQDAPFLFKMFSDFIGIHNISVMSDSSAAVHRTEHERLHIVEYAVILRCIPDMPDRRVPWEVFKIHLFENVIH